MLPQTPFYQFQGPRIDAVRERLEAMCYAQAGEPLAVQRTDPSHDHVTAAEGLRREFRSIEASKTKPHHWGRMWQQAWWKLTVPEVGDAPRRYLRWHDQAEATIFLFDRDHDEWVPYHGLDCGHLFAPLPDGFSGDVLIESAVVNTGIWVPGAVAKVDETGSRFEGCTVHTRDEDAWHLWIDFDLMVRVMKLLDKQVLPLPDKPHAGLFHRGEFRRPLDQAPPLLRRLLVLMSEACDAFDTESVGAAREVMARLYDELRAAPTEMLVTLTGHAHIDLAWRWPERIADFKAVHTFATASMLLEQYPEFHFGYSQPASYRAVEKRSPGMLRKVRDKIAGGRWEANGVMEVESDTQLPCGEALLRSIELGQQGFRELTGKDSDVLWLPDVFGYSPCLPQLLQGFGVPHFFTTKIHWGMGTKFPHSAFRWIGHDGSEVTSFIAWEHYNLEAHPEQHDWAAKNQRQAGIFNETLAATGYGDGGGGVNAEMCERVRRQADLAGVPRTKWGKISDFFNRLHDVRDRLPTWHGEMYVEFHRGVQTTHGHLKAAYRAAERGLQLHEAAAALTGKAGPADEPWRRVVFAQFHDYLPGSSIQEVYDEGVPELQAIADDATSAAKRLVEGGRTDCLFNALPMERTQLAEGRFVKLPPLSITAIAQAQTVDAPAVELHGSADAPTLSNGRVQATFDAAGCVTRLLVDGEAIALAGPANQLYVLPDHPAAYPAWDIDRPAMSLGQPATGTATQSSDCSDARRTLSFTRKLGKSSTATVCYILEAGACVLKVEVDVDWQEPNTVLKTAWPTKYNAREARYGAPFGSTMRAQIGDTATDESRFENPLSRWMCLGDESGGAGLMLLTEAKFGGAARDGLVHLSLLKSALITDAHGNRDLRDFDAYGGDAWTEFSDLGRATIRYAVGRFDPQADRGEQPAALAESLYTPALRVQATPAESPLLGIDGLASVHATWVRPAHGGGLVVRLNETLGRRGKITLRLADGWAATACDLRGENPQSLTNGELHVTPYGLYSVHVSRV